MPRPNKSPHSAVLSQNLRQRLLELKKLWKLKNNDQLADCLGVNRGTLDYWIGGFALPSLDTLYGVAQRLGLGIDDLIADHSLMTADKERLKTWKPSV